MSKFHSLTVKEVRRETEDTVSISFHVPEQLQSEFEFKQGQYLTLKQIIDGSDVRRSYSICSSPTDGVLRVAVKKVDGGMFSGFANEKLRAGDTLEAMPPMGNFFTELDPLQAKNYVLFAAGSGITPVISILRSVLLTEPNSTVTLVYGNKGFQSIIFREELEGLKNLYLDRFNLIHILSRENPGIPLYKGRIDVEKCMQLFDTVLDASEVDEAFICGPEEMISSVSECLKKLGVDDGSVHFELFTSPVGKLGTSSSDAPVQKLDDKDCEVSVTIDGDTVQFALNSQGESILEAAQSHGLDLPYACKGGVCCTCRAKLVEGEISMDHNYALRPDELAQNFILTCQSHPLTKKVTVDFDIK